VLLTEEGARRIEHLSPRKSLILEQKNSSSIRSKCPFYRVNCRVRCSAVFGVAVTLAHPHVVDGPAGRPRLQ